MRELTRKTAQPYYTGVQILYWLSFGMMFAFAAAYLRGRGFSNSITGLALGASCALSVVLQPLLALALGRYHIPLHRGIARISGAVALLSLCLFAFPLGKTPAALLVVCIFALESALQPSVNSLARALATAGLAVNFGGARGASSLAYSVMTALMGYALKTVSPNLLPAFYSATTLAMALVCGLIRLPDAPRERPQKPAARGDGARARLTRRFFMLLSGICCMSLGHTLTETFMLQIMQNAGGGSAQLGAALAIASAVEFPAMLLYGRVRKRFGDRRLFILSGWAWFLRAALLCLARAPYAIFASQLLQFFSYAVYVPACMACVGQMLPEGDFLKGQSWAGSAYTAGSVLAMFAGGVLLDALGVRGTLPLVAAAMLAGALLFTFSAQKPTGR